MNPLLNPQNTTLHIVRWIRADGTEIRHRYFWRLRDAVAFHDKLAASGKTVAMFETPTEWTNTDSATNRRTP